MTEIDFHILDWLAGDDEDPEHAATMGMLRISLEAPRLDVTEVHDTLAKTVRQTIHVPLAALARWLVVNWWRLRWEDDRAANTSTWRRAHRLSSADGAHAWPGLSIWSDGPFVRLHMAAETTTDVAAIRYLNSVDATVSAAAFTAAVDRFVGTVVARLDAVAPAERGLAELWKELAAERRSLTLTNECRWQALAGIDPGEAPSGWLDAARALVEEAGNESGDEIVAVVPDLEGGLSAAEARVRLMKSSSTTMNLSWIQGGAQEQKGELPWQFGARLAQDLRARQQLGEGPLTDAQLGDLVSTHVPFVGNFDTATPLDGGFRNGVTGGRTHVVGWGKHASSHRFFLGRMLGAAHVLGADQHVLPATKSRSALQKMQRSFAQEFLCPWKALDEFTRTRGTDDDGLAEAAAHFRVSDWVIRSTLVNRGKLARHHLPDGA